MQDWEISPEGLEFQPVTKHASSLVEIPPPRVRFPYPAWTCSWWILFLPPLSWLFLGPAWTCEIEVSLMGQKTISYRKMWEKKIASWGANFFPLGMNSFQKTKTKKKKKKKTKKKTKKKKNKKKKKKNKKKKKTKKKNQKNNNNILTEIPFCKCINFLQCIIS